MSHLPVSTTVIHSNGAASDPSAVKRALLRPLDRFPSRHLGPTAADVETMLAAIGAANLDALIHETLPDAILADKPLDLGPARSESQVLAELKVLAQKNKLFRSYIGMGYANTITPPVIQRNILENPGWYTQYTPYQAEIAQGRLQALLNFQTLISDLTGLEIANASMLDEATAAAEAMTLALRAQPRRSKANRFFVSNRCQPQTIAVVQTRAEPLGIDVVVGDHERFSFDATGGEGDTFGVLLQYPTTDGDVLDYDDFCQAAHAAGALVVIAADLLALTLLRAPGEFGADIVVGNSQRFGVPLGYGGPHAAFMATRDEHKRLIPGRIVGVSKDRTGAPALRLALQTREQHIRRDRATSNICTAQVLLAIMAGMYAVYHGPAGVTQIAQRVRLLIGVLKQALNTLGYETNSAPVFDTLRVYGGPRNQAQINDAALAAGINLRYFDDGSTGVSLDETVTTADLQDVLGVFGGDGAVDLDVLADAVELDLPAPLARTTPFMTHEVFNSYHSETEMLRYLNRLQGRDLSLTHSMIPLGSCTMKLNATVEMLPITWPEFGQLHPFVPRDQAQGYTELFTRLEKWLADITGFAAVSLQPNAGSQGEYTGLLVIRAYHHSRGDDHRNVCLIPSSAHGTNPASAVMAGMEVIVVACDDGGNVDLDDLRARAEKYSDRLAALMVTYPSTHGVFETEIKEICNIIHQHGGQVYMDGANMNAQVGLSTPGGIGADVCHLNLHKTFCIPHGGGGPGMGPIGVAAHLAPFLPSHPVVPGVGGAQGIGAVAAAPWGSPSILPISYVYIAMMGSEGLAQATRLAILNANYIAARLDPHFPVLYKGAVGRVAHECIIDLRPLKDYVHVDDVAKRLMDYGFHAPTMSFPVAGTLMIEPTESESLAELDRFCEAMIAIRSEIQAIADGVADHEDNLLTGAPHTAALISSDDWSHPYSRQEAAFPLPWVNERKFWPYVARIDNVYGDRNLICNCISIEAFATE